VLDDEGRYTDASTAAARTQRKVPLFEMARYAILGWQGLLLLGLVVGTWRTGKRHFGLLLGLSVVPVYVLALSGGPEASPRFRVLYLPVFALLTAIGLEALTSLRNRSGPAQRRGRASDPEREPRKKTAHAECPSPAAVA